MDSIKKLTDLFARFPTIGQRTAGRFVYYLIGQPKESVRELLEAIAELKNKVKRCQFCFNPYEGDGLLCRICQNPSRRRDVLCVVEKEVDLTTIENTGKYQGLYFILGDTARGFKKDNQETLRLSDLQDRLKDSAKFGLSPAEFKEIIIGLNPTMEGRAAAVLVERLLKNPALGAGFKVTHLAQGLPVGGELEYADQETLESAFEGRK